MLPYSLLYAAGDKHCILISEIFIVALIGHRLGYSLGQGS